MKILKKEVIFSIFLLFSIVILVYKNISANTEIQLLRKTNISLETELYEIKISPERQFSVAKTLIENKEYEKGITELNVYIQKYPCSDKINEANKLLSTAKKDFEIHIKNEKEKQELLKKGFFNLKTNSTIKTQNTTLKIFNVRKNKEFISNRYNDRYYVSTSDKGSTYINIDFEVTSNSKNPKLPSIYVGEISETGEIRNIQTILIKYYHWSGHGEAIGLYYDMINDFKKVNTVKFSGFATVPNVKANFIVFTDSKEIYEIEEKISKDTVMLEFSDLNTLTLEEFVDKYKLIRIIN